MWLAALPRLDGFDPPLAPDLTGIAVPLPHYAFCEGGVNWRTRRDCRNRVTRGLTSLFGLPGLWGWSCGIHGRSENWAALPGVYR